MTSAETQGDEPEQKRVATRRLGDPVPGKAATSQRSTSNRKKARR